MTTAELLTDVRYLTRSNDRDYTDAEIENNINQEYYYLQQIAIEEGKPVYGSGAGLSVIDLAMATTFASTIPNLNINRVEAEIDGCWKVLTCTDSTKYGGPFRKPVCCCGYQGTCGCCQSLTEILGDEGTPCWYIQTNNGIEVFPLPEAASLPLNVKVYHEDCHALNWVGGDTPVIPKYVHRLLSLKAALLYRDIEEANDLQFLNNEYNILLAKFIDSLKGQAKILQMHFKTKRYK